MDDLEQKKKRAVFSRYAPLFSNTEKEKRRPLKSLLHWIQRTALA
jgi:hypothetical protein